MQNALEREIRENAPKNAMVSGLKSARSLDFSNQSSVFQKSLALPNLKRKPVKPSNIGAFLKYARKRIFESKHLNSIA